MNLAEKEAIVYYRSAPGIDSVTLGDDQVLLRNEAGVMRIEGAMAGAFLGRLLPFTGRWRSRDELRAFFS